jgi:prepilin-type N-terminal cleavage/methylation domain-containing protein
MRTATPSPSPTRALTLTEVLLVMAIVAILAALLAPSLSGTRDAAKRRVNLSDLRSHTAVFAAYANENRHALPFVTRPDVEFTVLGSGDHEVSARFFWARNLWPLALARSHYNTTAADPIFYAKNSKFNQVDTYEYAPTCFSLPAFWNAQTRTGPDQWRPVTIDSVLFPSHKGILANFADAATSWANYTLAGSSPDVAWIDGSATTVRHDELSAPYGPAEGQWGGPPTPFGRVIMHTVDGARGRDR